MGLVQGFVKLCAQRCCIVCLANKAATVNALTLRHHLSAYHGYAGAHGLEQNEWLHLATGGKHQATAAIEYAAHPLTVDLPTRFDYAVEGILVYQAPHGVRIGATASYNELYVFVVFFFIKAYGLEQYVIPLAVYKVGHTTHHRWCAATNRPLFIGVELGVDGI